MTTSLQQNMIVITIDIITYNINYYIICAITALNR